MSASADHRVRYLKLGFVELNVADLAQSRDFYGNLLGLQYVGRGPEGEERLRCGDDPYSVVLHQSDTPGHKRTGWRLEDEDQFEPLERRLIDAGVTYFYVSDDDCRARDLGRTLRTAEPSSGAVLDFYVAADPDAHFHFTPTVASIKQLGHVVFTTPRLAETVAFYTDVLNFAESDTIEEAFTFMRPWPNRFHHGIGIGRSGTTLYHHTNFMVSEIDDVGRAIHRLNEAGAPIVYGPGRHPASGSVFLYFLDPDGLTCEYSFGMEEFPEAYPRPPRRMAPVKGVGDSWGAPMDPRMGAKGAIEELQSA